MTLSPAWRVVQGVRSLDKLWKALLYFEMEFFTFGTEFFGFGTAFLTYGTEFLYSEILCKGSIQTKNMRQSRKGSEKRVLR